MRTDPHWASVPLAFVLGYCAAVVGYLALATTRDSNGNSCGRLLLPDSVSTPAWSH